MWKWKENNFMIFCVEGIKWKAKIPDCSNSKIQQKNRFLTAPHCQDVDQGMK